MRLTDEVHLLTEASLSRLKEESILSNLRKETQRIFFYEETGEFVPKKRTR